MGGQGEPREAAADRWVHILGVAIGTVCAVTLVQRATSHTDGDQVLPVVVYAFGLIAMLYCSAAYNLAAHPARRAILRRLDHAAIFLLIAGTYTPFTTRVADGAESWALTAVIWAIALVGVMAKLVAPGRFERGWIVVYLALGWTVLVAFGPMTATLDQSTVELLVAGGILYSVGVVFYVWSRLRFHRAIWHACVLAASGCHYWAVMQVVG